MPKAKAGETAKVMSIIGDMTVPEGLYIARITAATLHNELTESLGDNPTEQGKVVIEILGAFAELAEDMLDEMTKVMNQNEELHQIVSLEIN